VESGKRISADAESAFRFAVASPQKEIVLMNVTNGG
jgi:hypothetical protein